MKKGWEIKTLGEVCEIYQPKTISTSEMVPDGEFPVFGANGIIGKYNQYNHENEELLITCRGATCGSVNISLPKSWINGNAMVVRPKIAGLDRKFLEFYFRGAIDISKTITGSAQPQITRQTLSPSEIPIPPLPEQQHIVSILDEAFAAIDKAKENVQRNLQNAKELFQSELNSIFENKGEGWTENKLNEVCEVKDGTHDSPKYLEEGIPFVTQKNIRESGLSFDNTRFITQTDHDKFFKRSNVSYGDILLSMIGANRGMACIVDDKRVFSIKNVCLIKANENINQNYLLYYLKSQKAINFVKSASKGGAQEFIGLTELRNFPTPLAPLKEQKKIVSQLDTLSTETKNLENIYQQKLNALEELKKSILQKAFSGELRSPEGASSANDGHRPSDKKKAKLKASPERA